MRPEDQDNSLDLNNLPEDHHYGRDVKQALGETSSVVVAGGSQRKKKSGGQGGKDDEDGKVYECRFCSLKFCKSQALGGHMNRHRQERETETLNKARQLVFHNDTLAAPPSSHLGCCHPIPPGGYQYPAAAGGSIGVDPTILPLRYPARMFPGSSSSTTLMIPTPPSVHPPPQQQPPYLYSSPPGAMSFPAAPHYPPHPQHNDYYVGHVLNSNGAASTPPLQYAGHLNVNYALSESNNYTCIGAPVGPGGGRDGSSLEEGMSWSRSYAGTHPPPPPPPINRFQHGF